MQIHVVNYGETLESIAARYNISTSLLQKINMLPNPENLLVGQDIVIAYPNLIHTVRTGEGADTIAAQYGISLRELYRNNPDIANGRELFEGESLIIEFVETQERPVKRITGYAYPNIDREILYKTLPYLTYLTIFTYGFSEDGELVTIEDDELIAIARSYGTAPIMLVSTLTPGGGFSNRLANIMLNNAQIQQKLIDNIIRTLKEKKYYGLDIDFEYVYERDREAYVSFIENITEQCNAEGFEVMVALAPKTSSTQRGLLYEAHDYGAIGAAADYVLLMTYEWGYSAGPPMAVAPINKVREVLDYAVTQIEREKIFMGVPNYGYDWRLPFIRGESKAPSIGNVEAIERGVQYRVSILFDEKAQSPYYYYTDSNGQAHVVWFENARSIMAKGNLVDEYGFIGMSIWNVMRYFPQMWLVFNLMFEIETLEINEE